MAPPGPERLAAAANALGLEIEIRRMPASTRTAEDAAAACGCALGAIVKSLVFEAESGDARKALRLLLVSGANRVDTAVLGARTGERLSRADPKAVRAATGFAIGGIPPFGHESAVPAWMDRDLLGHATVWAAAGAPDAVFEIAPADLVRATGAEVIDMA